VRIDLLHYSVPPVVGGVESVLAQHASLMADAGHAVRALAGRGEQFDKRVQLIPVPLVDSRHPEILKIKSSLDQGHIPLEFEGTVRALYEVLNEITAGTEILIAHNVCSLNKNLPLTAALFQLSQERGAPHLILWHHDLAWTTPRYRSELHNGRPWELLRMDWPGTTQVVVSELRRQELVDLMRVTPERIIVVPNGLDLARFLKLEDHSVGLVKELELLRADPLLLLPVRITPRKNIELALRIVADLRGDFPNIKLVVTGPLGPHNPDNIRYFERLLSLRQELGLIGTVHFLAEYISEYLPDRIIADFYRLADALLLPSREEGFGIPLLEAGLAGIPIFCSDIPPLRELAGDHALYFSADSRPEDVADQIGRLLKSSPTYAMRVRVRSQYSWEQVYRERIEPVLQIGSRSN